MKKILLAINKLTIGGAETVVLNQANLLDKTKFKVYVGVLYEASDDNTLFHRLTLPEEQIVHFNFPRRSPWSIRAWYRVYKFLKEHQIDMVMTNLFDANMVVRIAAVFARTSVIISTEHSTYISKGWWQKLVDWVLSFTTDIIFGVSEEVINFTSEQEHISKKKFRLLPQVVDLDLGGIFTRSELRTRLGIPEAALVCMTVGRFSPEKAQYRIIEIAYQIHKRSLANIHFLIVGYGFLGAELRRQVQELQIENLVTIVSDPKQAREYLIAGDVFLLTSNREGGPLVLLEAMNQGLVPIVPEVGWVPSVVRDDLNGYILDSDRIKEIAEKIFYLEKNRNHLIKLANAARRDVRSASGIVSEFESLLFKVGDTDGLQ